MYFLTDSFKTHFLKRLLKGSSRELKLISLKGSLTYKLFDLGSIFIFDQAFGELKHASDTL